MLGKGPLSARDVSQSGSCLRRLMLGCYVSQRCIDGIAGFAVIIMPCGGPGSPKYAVLQT